MAEDEKPQRDFGKILALAFVGLNFAVMGAGLFLVYSSTLGHEKPSVSEEELNKEFIEFRNSLQNNPVLYTMKTFNTNLEGVPRRFIRVGVSLEMLDEEGYEEVIGMGAEARDSIVRILNDKKFSDVESVQGKLKLKNQIIANLNGFLKRGVVRNVYFSDFVIQ